MYARPQGYRLHLTRCRNMPRMIAGDPMYRFGRIATILVVWTTTASMLVASVPHYICRCPNGNTHVQFFGGEASCCSARCCGSAPKERACCRGKKSGKTVCNVAAKRSTAPRNLDGQLLIGATECQKSLVCSDHPTVVRENVTSPVGDQFALSLPADRFDVAVADAHARPHTLPIDIVRPPTDLVSTFQRLTI